MPVHTGWYVIAGHEGSPTGIQATTRGFALMTHFKCVARYGMAVLIAAGLGCGLAQAQTPQAHLTAAQLANHQEMDQLGLKYKTAWDLFQALKQQAHGGTPITDTTMPDWSGIYVRTKGGTAFDPD